MRTLVTRRDVSTGLASRRSTTSAVALLLAAAAFSSVTATPLAAASLTSVTFVVAATPALAFSEAASRLALSHSDNVRIHRFARRDDAVQKRAAEAFVAWGMAERARAVAAVETRSLDMLGPIFGLGTLLGLGNSYDVSVALLPPRLRSDVAENSALTSLATLTGADFDSRYASTQVDALARLVAVYTDFIENGDDVALRTLAVRQLPKVKMLLAEARRL